MLYTKYLKYILIGFAIACLTYLGIVFYQIGVPTQTARWIYELDRIKISYAKSIESPKILLVSGSNTLYGLSCATIFQETKIPCVNTALTQELGLDYILSHAQRLANPNDTILIPLEYQLYLSKGSPSELSIDYVFGYDPNYFKSVDLFAQIKYIGGISSDRLIQGISTKLKPTSSQKKYANRINQYGDTLDNGKDKMTEQQFKLMDTWSPFTLNKYAIDNYAKNKIIEFITWSRKNNINVIATWPSTVNFEVYQKPDTQAFFQNIESLYQSQGVPVLGKAEDFLYDKSLFFNSVYHLNDIGRNQRTKQIINLIQPYLKNS
ncbi:hypothetical protein ACE1B6_07550 [Aerosakkonemataceae cyanobacterium BLCC-F154]|uniref:DUF1574 domain-containing protein n=1 Tax=Floridaenema fluviatile BLCC-F154 TaxID=3153640 RepID=A0ABV4Y8I6_9CYAN